MYTIKKKLKIARLHKYTLVLEVVKKICTIINNLKYTTQPNTNQTH